MQIELKPASEHLHPLPVSTVTTHLIQHTCGLGSPSHREVDLRVWDPCRLGLSENAAWELKVGLEG